MASAQDDGTKAFGKFRPNRPWPVHVVDNNPGHVHVVDNNPENVHVVDNYPGPGDVHVVDNNPGPGSVHVVDNNPGHVNVVNNNPDFVLDNVDPGFYQPSNPGAGEPVDISPTFVQNRPPYPYDDTYRRLGK